MLRVLRRLEEAVRYNRWTASRLWRGLSGRVTCLLYHRIAGHGEQSYLERGGVPVTPPQVLRRQLGELRRHGAAFFTLDDLARGAYPGPDRPGFVVTFDDGYRDNFTTALPILEDAGVRAVFFITTALVGRRSLFWEHQLFRLASHGPARRRLAAAARERLGSEVTERNVTWVLGSLATPATCDELLAETARAFPELPAGEPEVLYPTWEDLRRARRSGHQIGSHTVNHRMRHLLPECDFLRELTASRTELESALQVEVPAFSYPYNSYFFGDEALCLRAGYKQVATVDPGRLRDATNLLWVPRLPLDGSHDRPLRFRRLVLEEMI